MEEKIICRVLTGPTASGKTDLSLELAEKHGWEICCMDSMQVYRGMDIGTAKPTAEERNRVPHHLLDLLDPAEPFSVSDYVAMAEEIVRRKAAEGKELLFVGGTGLYLQALIRPLAMGAVPADEGLRAELNALADGPGGREALDGLLRAVDPETADRLPLNDIRRRIRAIEVSRKTGIPFSRQPDRAAESPFRWRVAAAEMPRQTLYDRINRRVCGMMDRGLAEEVRGLLKGGLSPEAQSMQAIGYKETIHYLAGEWSLEKTVEEIQKGTRHYAKRQMTFLRRMAEIRYFSVPAQDASAQAEKILTEE